MRNLHDAALSKADVSLRASQTKQALVLGLLQRKQGGEPRRAGRGHGLASPHHPGGADAPAAGRPRSPEGEAGYRRDGLPDRARPRGLHVTSTITASAITKGSMVLVNPGPEGARHCGFHLIPQKLAAWPTSAKRVPPDGGYGSHACLQIVGADGREHGVRICASPGSSGRIRKARAHHAPTARIFDFPAERTGFVCRGERCCPGPGGRAEARDLRAKRPSPPRCREANGGVAVVAADGAGGVDPNGPARRLADWFIYRLRLGWQREYPRSAD